MFGVAAACDDERGPRNSKLHAKRSVFERKALFVGSCASKRASRRRMRLFTSVFGFYTAVIVISRN